MAPEVKDPSDTETAPPAYLKRVVIQRAPDDEQPAVESANPALIRKGGEWWRKGGEWWRKGNPKRNCR